MIQSAVRAPRRFFIVGRVSGPGVAALEIPMVFRISAEQLSDLAKQRFEKKLIDLIAQHDPEARASLETPDGRAELRHQCERARAYGLSRSADLARYVVTAWLMGLDFDSKHDAMREVLTSNRLSPAQKADAIGKITVAVLRTLAKN